MSGQYGTTTIEGFGSSIGSALMDILATNEIVPGSDVSYQMAKTIYTMLPIGAKLVEVPIEIAQSKRRDIACPEGPEHRLVEAFNLEWDRLKATDKIANLVATSRMYGIASLGLLEEGKDPSEPLDFAKIADATISINLYDPLNTAGSLVLNQDPGAMDFQHVTEITVGGKTYHKSRTCVLMNGRPIYINYTTSAFGFVGRSVYQNTLFPLKSYLQSLLTDDMVVRKAGVIVAKLKPQGSIIDNLMQGFLSLKREAIKLATTYNVLSIGHEEAIESIDLTNLHQPYELARRNILGNIAAGDNMPAILLTQETFAEGFGEGTEDANTVVRYIDLFRERMAPAYEFFDKLTMHRAWSKEFYAAIQSDYPEYKKIKYEDAFYRWKNSFKATWPSLIKEPDSEKIKVDEVKLDKLLAAFEVLAPHCDPDNLATLVQWVADNFNEMKMLFDSPLVLDYESLAAHALKNAEMGQALQEQGGFGGKNEEDDKPMKPVSLPKPSLVKK